MLTLLLVLGALLPLAEASPPDPLWIAGIYDDADHDDVVALATSVAATLRPAVCAGERPSTVSPALVSELDRDCIHAADRAPESVRAPPTR